VLLVNQQLLRAKRIGIRYSKFGTGERILLILIIQDIMEYLPLELCRAIANHLDAADRYQLVQVCRNFYALFLPSLYQDVVLCGDSKTTTFRFSLRGHDSLVLRRLELVAHQIDSKPFLACYIRHLRICHHSTTPHEFLPASGVNVLRAILQRLEGLTKMTFLMVPLMHTDLHFISSAMPNGLQHLIVEQCSLTFDRDESFELPGVQECSIYGPLSPEILSHQSSWAHIVTLDLSRDMPTMLGRILHPHPPHEPSFCLPRLRHLNVWHLGETVIQFLSCASALESLTCWSYGYISRSLSKVLPNDVVPKLQEFRGCALYGPVLTPGRPIRHLALGEMKTHRHLPGLRIGSIAPNFGSSVPLESLIINHLDRDLKNYLAEILLKCPLIHELAVTTHTGNEWGVDAVSP